MSQFKDPYGILALAATKKITPQEDMDEIDEFFGKSEKIPVAINNRKTVASLAHLATLMNNLTFQTID